MSSPSSRNRILNNGEDPGETSKHGDYKAHLQKQRLPGGTGGPHLPSLTRRIDIGNDTTLGRVSKSETICFGMLKGIQALFNYRPNTYSSVLDKLSGDNGKFTTLQLAFLENRCIVLVNDVPIGTMGTKIHFALASLSSAPMLSYNAAMPQSELRHKLTAAAKSSRDHPSKIYCNMALNIFGPRSVKDTLAKELARFRLFLQHPVPIPERIAYENPQYLSTASSSFGNGAILPPIPTDIFRHETSNAGTSDQDEATTITTVVDSLPAYNCVGNIDIDKRIRTTLLDHQTEAVDFIIWRESTEKQATMLWKLESFISEKPIYKHAITGAVSQIPKDILGGIFADGMGLGKTLSMIACIVSSLAYANEFAYRSSTADSPTPVSCTLVIVPSVLLLNSWADEIERHVVPRTLSIYKYHGPNRMLPSSSPLPYDVILSTYGTVAADFRRGGGVLACFHWYRLILDEAHVIRNWSTKQFKAINDLSALIRWCVTGTPVQNSLKDLASLLVFLRLPLLDDPATFRKHIEGRHETISSASKTNYRNLRCLLESICLRRCTSSILSSLGVSLIKRSTHLSEGERKGYNELSSLCDRYIKAAVNGKSSKIGNKPILIAVLRLRMFCNTGLLGPMDGLLDDTEDEDRLLPDEVISLLQQCGEAVCTSCKIEVSSSDVDAHVGKKQDPAHGRLKCGGCAHRTVNAQKKRKASQDLQRYQIAANSDVMHGIQFEHSGESVSLTDNLHETPYPSKLLSLADDIRTHYDQDKSIVFSFWRRSLDLVEKLFTEKGIIFGRVDGSIHPSKRSEVLKTFQENPSIRVLLMTIGAGAVGLNNLSVASRVHILEPQWNPSMEDQAIGRVARLGQSRAVTVVRYIVKNTIEESIESRQLQKLQLALRSGLKSSDQDPPEAQRRIDHLQELRRIIKSSVGDQRKPPDRTSHEITARES